MANAFHPHVPHCPAHLQAMINERDSWAKRELPRVGPARGGASSETWSPGPHSFLGPLLLVPKMGGGGDEDVWLVTTVHTAGKDEACHQHIGPFPLEAHQALPSFSIRVQRMLLP